MRTHLLGLVAVSGLVACQSSSGDHDTDVLDGVMAGEPECGVVDGEFWGCDGRARRMCSYPEERCIEPERDCTDAWCRIPAMTFLMGSAEPFVDLGELPRRPIRLTRSFYIQKDETTVSDWEAVMGHDPTPMDYPRKFDHPVFSTSVFDILEYANRRSASEGLEPCYMLEDCEVLESSLDCDRATFVGADCKGYRLPSEAEWELVAGEGTGDCIPGRSVRPVRHSHGWFCSDWKEENPPVRYCGNSEVAFPGCINLDAYDGPVCAGPGPIAEFAPNAFGVRGMVGNVMEYVGSLYLKWPWFAPDVAPLEFVVDPGFDTTIFERSFLDNPDDPRGITVKGGSFRLALGFTCSYSRQMATFEPQPLGFAGFRLARTVIVD